MSIVSSVFNNETDAQQAVDWLRSNGVPENAISIASRNQQDVPATTAGAAGDDAAEMGKGAASGLGIGAGVGALFGLAAAAIPGVGPFITAGALSAALGPVLGGAAAGAIVGGTSGGIAGALSHWGLNEAEAKHYGGEIERGGVYVGVDTSRTNVADGTIRQAFQRFNGNMYAAA